MMTSTPDPLVEPLLEEGGSLEANEGTTTEMERGGLVRQPTSEALMSQDAVNFYSLAYHRKTPTTARWLVCLSIVVTHLLFLWGQTSPMWYLYFSVDANVTTHADTLETKMLFHTVGLDNPFHFATAWNTTIKEFDYWEAVQTLWEAQGIKDKYNTRIGAACIVLFSGVWPHVKLILLQVFWFVKTREQTRTGALYWLGTFGKWSLADVFLVCVLIGVLNLDLPINSNFLVHQVEKSVPEIVTVLERSANVTEFQNIVCNDLVRLNCTIPAHSMVCSACESTCSFLYSHPKLVNPVVDRFLESILNGITTMGGGRAQLRIAGMGGIYVYCTAVVFSLALSVVIDTMDHKAKKCRAKALHHLDGSIPTEASPLISSEDPKERSEVLYERVKHVFSWRKYQLLIVVALLVLGMVVIAIVVPAFVRRTPGSVPEIVNATIGVSFERNYSLVSLSKVIAEFGGWDYYLQGVFVFFCIVGPVARSLLLIMQLVIPGSESFHRRVLFLVNTLGAFCAWDVFLLALVLVATEMPSITATILNPNSFICVQLASYGYPDYCLQVEFVPLAHYSVALVGGMLLMVACTVSSKLVFRGMNPYKDDDPGGPYCGNACCTNCIWDPIKRWTSSSSVATTPLFTDDEPIES